MAKEIVAHIKLQIPAGQANPAPPVGTALGPRGVNIMAFCKEFNAATQKQAGDILPGRHHRLSRTRSFTFITKSPPAADPVEEGREHRRRLERAEQDQGRQSDAQTGHGHREDEGQRPESRSDEAGFRDHRRHRPPDGPRDRRLGANAFLVKPRRARVARNQVCETIGNGSRAFKE